MEGLAGLAGLEVTSDEGVPASDGSVRVGNLVEHLARVGDLAGAGVAGDEGGGAGAGAVWSEELHDDGEGTSIT